MSKYALWLCCLVGCPATTFAGAWTLPQGKFWGKATFLHQNADEWYLATPQFTDGVLHDVGARKSYRFNGEYDLKAFIIEGFYGVTDRFDLGVKMPYFDQVFRDDTRKVAPEDAGFSDLWVYAKWRALLQPALLTVAVGAKIPTGKFKNEDGFIPVGEGQWDFDFGAQLGRSFWPLPLYGNIDVGYRVRKENKQIRRDPGDEWFLNAEVGYTITRRLMVMAKYERLRGDPAVEFGFLPNQSKIKQITYFCPTLSYGVLDHAALELALRVTVNGQNFPAGRQLALGFSGDLDVLSMLGRRQSGANRGH